MGSLAVWLAALAVAAPLALHAQAETPLEQLRAGVAPDRIECGGDLVLVAWRGQPACLREQSAARLGLEAAERPHAHQDAPVLSDSAVHEAIVPEIRAHILVPVPEAREPEKIPVPPPERRVPVESLSSFRGEPLRVTIMVDADRTGYFMPMTKAKTDELVYRFAAILGEKMDYESVQKIRGEDSGFVEVTEDFDFLGDEYEFYYFTEDAVFTTGNQISEYDPFATSPPSVGKLDYVNYFSKLSSVDHMELITRFMDEMDFDGWTVYDPYGEGSRTSQYNYKYYLFRGTHSDGPDTSTTDRLYALEPYVRDLELSSPEAQSGQPSADYVRANYEQTKKEHARELASRPLPKNTEPDGLGIILFRFNASAVSIKFSGWSKEPIPDPVISPKDAVERAIEFAKTDEILSGPRCGLNIPDRSVEDEPRYVDLAYVGGVPFWKVLMGPCDTRNTVDELVSIYKSNYWFSRLLGDLSLDVIDGRKVIKLDRNGDIDLTSIGIAPLSRDDQTFLNHLHDINVAVYVDAIDGENTWFSETGYWSYANKLSYQTYLKDDNVWFLEDGQVVFAEDWPKGYLGETFLSMEVKD